MNEVKVQPISLPIDTHLENILKNLKKYSNVILSSDPGSGKTTRLPYYLTRFFNKILVLEPRRIAAISAAYRICEENSLQVGEQVGYQVRFDSKFQKDTQLLFMTEALLLKKLAFDSTLKDIDLVILDEFHERSIYTDISIAALKELQSLERPELKILVMSASLDPKTLLQYLDSVTHIHIPAPRFELKIQKINQTQLVKTDSNFIDRVYKNIQNFIEQNPNRQDLLVFLPGKSEISRVYKSLDAWAAQKNLEIHQLTGSSPIEEQKSCLKKSNHRKIILSTNVAESSITIDGVDSVIDSGLARISKYNPKTGLQKILNIRSSKASALQRAGRSARQKDGFCLQLWSPFDERSIPDFDIAEVHQQDLCEALLLIASLNSSFKPNLDSEDVSTSGIRFDQFSWFEKPNIQYIQKAQKYLNQIGALEDFKITKYGLQLMKFPLKVQWAHLLLCAESLKIPSFGSKLCLILSEPYFHSKDSSINFNKKDDLACDLDHDLDLFNRLPESSYIKKQHKQLLKLLNTKIDFEPDDLLIQKLLCLALPQFLAKRTDSKSNEAKIGESLLPIQIKNSSQLKSKEFFIALEILDFDSGDLNKRIIARKIYGIDDEIIKGVYTDEIKKVPKLCYDKDSEKFYIEESSQLFGLKLLASNQKNSRRAPSSDEIHLHIVEFMIENWDYWSKQNADLFSWLMAFEYYVHLKFQNQIEQSSPQIQSEDFLKDVLAQASYNENSPRKIIEKDLVYFFENKILQDFGANLLNDFKTSCPLRIQIQNKTFKIEYLNFEVPVLKIKIQDLIGTTETPKIFHNQISLNLHILGPNYRPVQVTNDLKSFWANTYPEVKKELKSRYPKHKWP